MPDYHYSDGLKSRRLTTRFLTSDDALNWVQFFNDDESMQFFPNPESLNVGQRAHVWIERQLNRYREQKYGLQALLLNGTNEFVGQCGLLLQEVDGVMEVEVGYHILKEYRNSGYASEAAMLFTDYALDNRMAASVVSVIHRKNFKSQRVAEKNGLRNEKATFWNGKEVFVYRRFA